MNIWYFSAYDQPKGHSSRTFWYSSELVKRGHQVTMFTNSYCHFTKTERLPVGEKWRVEHIDGVQVIWLNTMAYSDNGWRRGANMLHNALRCVQASRELQDHPDVIIGPSVPILTGLAAARVADSKKSSFVFEVRDIWPQALVDLGVLSKGSPVYWIIRAIEKYLYARADRISAVLPLTGRHVKETGGDERKVCWIPNGVNLASFEGLPTYDGGRKTPLTAMYIGGYSITHDVTTILRAARILNDRGVRDYRFIFVGDGKEREICKNEATKLGLSNVQFYDPVPKDKIPLLQLESDVLIASVKNTPVYQFGINSNKIFDYLGSGRPIIFSGNAPNDPITESRAGISIPPENPELMSDALSHLSRMSAEARREMGLRGRKYAEDYLDIRRLVVRLEHLLTETLPT